MEFEIEATAAQELGAAFQYYEACLQGLGWEFLADVERTFSHIMHYPESGQLLEANIRRRLTRDG